MPNQSPRTATPKSKTSFWLTIIGLIILSVLFTIFTINFNLQQIKKAGSKNDLFSTIYQYFVKQFTEPTFIPSVTPAINYQTINND